MRVEIYGLFDPRQMELRYVGKANDSAERLQRHLRDRHRRRTPLYDWMNAILGEGVCPLLQVIAVTLSGQWQETEVALIAQWHPLTRLLNLAEGGNAPPATRQNFSPEQRRQMGLKASATRTSTPEKARAFKLKQFLGREMRFGRVSEKTKGFMRYAAHKRPDLFGIWVNV